MIIKKNIFVYVVYFGTLWYLWNTLVHYYFALQKCHESKNRCQSFFFMLLISG